jgi:hypothetical protein
MGRSLTGVEVRRERVRLDCSYAGYLGQLVVGEREEMGGKRTDRRRMLRRLGFLGGKLPVKRISIVRNSEGEFQTSKVRNVQLVESDEEWGVIG